MSEVESIKSGSSVERLGNTSSGKAEDVFPCLKIRKKNRFEGPTNLNFDAFALEKGK